MLGRRSVVDCGIRMNRGSGNILAHQRTYEVSVAARFQWQKLSSAFLSCL